jgi:hypothetical protein
MLDVNTLCLLASAAASQYKLGNGMDNPLNNSLSTFDEQAKFGIVFMCSTTA